MLCNVLRVRNQLISLTQVANKSILMKHKSRNVKDKFPSAFVQMMNSWNKCIKVDAENYVKKMTNVILGGSEEAISNGYAISPLTVISNRYNHISNRSEVEFEIKDPNPHVKNVFGARSPVSICNEDTMDQVAFGIVMKSSVTSIKISVTDNFKHSNNISYLIRPHHLATSIEAVSSFIEKDLNPNLSCKNLIDISFRAKLMPSIHHDNSFNSIQSLNDSQYRSVAAALNPNRPFVCIQGPPGTGKTNVVIEIILQCIRSKTKILVVAQTHAALAEIIDRLNIMTGDDSYISIEHIDKKVYDNNKDTLDDIILDKMLSVDKKKEAGKRINEMRKKALLESFVVFSTASNSMIRYLPRRYGWTPDILLMDEAGQVAEPSTWISASNSRRIVLVGDPKQLPPLVLMDNKKDMKNSICTSLLERLMRDFSSCNSNFILNEQFRMNKDIMEWSNINFYDGILKAHPNVANQVLRDICNDIPDSYNFPMMFIDMDSIGGVREEFVNQSFQNKGEARQIVLYVDKLISYGLKEEDIGVISPYFAQTAYMRYLLKNRLGIMVNTVDAFQGKQKEVILFSVVRNNQKKQLGFVNDNRRMNVAVTRAKRQFVLFGSEKMLLSNPLLYSLRKVLVRQVSSSSDTFNLRKIRC